MTFAFGHLIGAWLAGKIGEFSCKDKFKLYVWFWLILGGIIPDLDYLVNFILGINFHRTFTHSFLFVILAWLITFLTFKLLAEKQAKKYAFAFSMGILVHLLIDFFSPQGVPFLWPLNYYFSPFGITLGKSGSGMLNASLELGRTFLKLAIVDMGLGAAWICYLGLKKKIKF